MDVLSDILRSSSCGAALLSRCDYRGRFGVEIAAHREAGLHFVEAGSVWLRVGGDAPLHLLQGDVAVLPHGSTHVLSDQPRRRAQPLDDFLAQAVTADASNPVTARIMCAAQRFTDDLRQLHPLIRELPEVIHIGGASVQRCPSLSPCLRLLLDELDSEQPGRSATVELLIEAFVVYVIRHWLSEQIHSGGWVGAIRDPGLARALAAMHERPERAWTVVELARAAGMSRPAFARKFKDNIGEGPMTYLTGLRIRKGASFLRETDATLAAIAAKVGYASEFAFSRAFKRVMGHSPSAFRSGPDGHRVHVHETASDRLLGTSEAK